MITVQFDETNFPELTTYKLFGLFKQMVQERNYNDEKYFLVLDELETRLEIYSILFEERP